MITEEGRMRFIIEEARTNEILIRDLDVQNPKILKKLSGPAVIEFDIDYREPSVQGIIFKPWGHWCHVEKMVAGKPKIIASGIFKPSEVDPETGKLHAQFEGFSGYLNGMPWLQNWNPIAVDPFEIVYKIWTHLQSFSNGNLGVTVYSPGVGGSKVTPPVSNTQLLPGLSLQNNANADFILEFFAIFIRAIDFTDCGDYVNKLARDIPFDYFEEAEWNNDKTAISKFIRLEYPHGGVLQSNLAFRLGENILRAKSRIESEIEWTSDVIIRGWFPGKVYSSELSNADSTRYRRTILEEDAFINSIERSEAWGHRQLTRRQFPRYLESVVLDMYHPNARFGTWEVGDQIQIRGIFPWVGEIDTVHKIIAYSVDEATATCELSLRAEGAFNYDPITFETNNPNEVINGQFTSDLSGWTQASGSWTRDALVGNDALGSARVTADGNLKELISTAFLNVTPGDYINVKASALWENASSDQLSSPIWLSAIAYRAAVNEVQRVTVNGSPTSGTFKLNFDGESTNDIQYNASASTVETELVALPNVTFGDVSVSGPNGGPWDVTFAGSYAGVNVAQLGAIYLLNGGTNPSVTTSTITEAVSVEYGRPIFDTIVNAAGDSAGWQALSGKWKVPAAVTQIKLQLIVRPDLLTGSVWFDDVNVNESAF